MSQIAEEPKSLLFIWFLKIFKFFASVRLAIPLLTVLIIALAAGTIVESRHGTDAGRILIYESLWFSFLLVLIAVNLAAAAFDRFPWQKKHIAFVITHLGIILILAGSLATQKMMVDGQIAVAEGETEHRITLSQPLLYIFAEDSGQGWMMPLQKKAFAWEGRKILSAGKDGKLPFEMALTAFYPKARMTETIEKSETGPAALRLHLKSSIVDQKLWLVEDDPAAGQIQMGPAKFVFSKTLLKENPGQASEAGYLEAEQNGKVLPVVFPENMKLPAEFPLEGTPYKVRILKIFKNAVVAGKELSEKPDEASNPAVQFAVLGPGVEERNTAFANFPDFPTTHGMKNSASGFHFYYRLPDSGSKGQRHELRLVNTPEGLRAQVQTGLKVETLKPETGKAIPLGWMDLTFKVEDHLQNSAKKWNFSSHPPESQAEDLVPALRLNLKTASTLQGFWLGQGMKHDFEIEGKKYAIVFGEKKIPAGFKLTLKDFRVEKYPGTEKPASFESDVILKDDARGVVLNETVSMNKPLVYRGFHIFQASYLIQEGQPEISIFTVGRDPGVPVKYAGALIMIGGVLSMFFTRRPAKKTDSGVPEL